MTIDLGFAALTLPDGTPAGIVDVPGHERFLKNMLAGAGGVDVVLLVIAADESVMPQTKEHLDIVRLLDVKNGVVALTKADMVDPEWLDVVEDDVRSQLAGTFLETAPIIGVNSLKGTGIPELRKALLSAVSRTEQKNTAIPFRLPVDRVFTRPGFGTVVTGTLVAGTMRVGDSVEILPKRIATRVRGLHSHNKKQDTVEAGTRVAVNLAGVETEELQRGALLAAPSTLAPTQLFDATLRLLPDARSTGVPPVGSGGTPVLRNRARVRVYLGTAEILGRVQLLGVEDLEADKQCYVQFRAEQPFACARGDRFVVRSYSPMRTIGGGVVLDASPGRHRRMDPAVVDALAAKERGTPDDLLETWLRGAPTGAMIRDAAKAAGLSNADVQAALTSLLERGDVVQLDRDRAIHRSALSTATDRALNALSTYHSANPLRPGMPKEELRGALGRTVDPKAFSALVQHWVGAGLVTTDQTSVRRADFRVELNPRQQALLDRVMEAYRRAAFNVPTVDEVSEEIGAPPDAISAMIRVGQDQGLFARITEGLYYHRDTVEEAKRIVREQISKNGSITVSQFRDITGSSRKYALPVMEYFDTIKFTRRRGDERILFET